MFFRIVSPKNNAGDKQKVVPDLLLDNVRSIYLPLTEAGSKSEWTFKSTDVALIDEEKFSSLEHTINENLKNVCYIHGFYESVNSLSVRSVLNAYLERGDHNVFLLDWSDVGKRFYIRSYFSLKEMAKRVAQALKCMEELQLIRSEDIHIVGNSLGAHLGACISRELGSVRRLTGLDPAGPLYRWTKKDTRISKDDANFVDIIHTDMYKFGLHGQQGHVDFYPNGGFSLQPGCQTCYDFNILTPKRLCSHWRCWRYYCESLAKEDAFLAAAADSWDEFKKGNTRDIIPMGFCTPSDSSGLYFLQTSDQYPYGKGEEGLEYSD